MNKIRLKIRKLLFYFSALLLLQIITYNFLSTYRLRSFILKNLEMPQERIDSLYVQDFFVRDCDCGNDFFIYGSLELKNIEDELKTTLKADNLVFEVLDDNYWERMFENMPYENAYFVDTERHLLMPPFIKILNEALHCHNYSQTSQVAYVWILFDWVKIVERKSKWERKTK